MYWNMITDTGVAILCQELTKRAAKVTTLALIGTGITDTGDASLSKALKHRNCKVTTLHLSNTQITGASVCVKH